MKKQPIEETAQDDDLRPEYDFSGGERGLAYRPLQRGYLIREEHADGTFTETRVPPEGESVVLDPDVQEYFPDSESVNNALRTIIALFPKQPKRATTPKGDAAPKRRAASARSHQ